MDKTEMMKRYEKDTHENPVVMDRLGNDVLSEAFKEWEYKEFAELSWKAEAYDRLMNMNSLSKNDIQIVLDGNAWCAYRLPFRNLQEDDAGFGATPQIALTALLESELPDGWEVT